MKKMSVLAITVLMAAIFTGSAVAVPRLQTYIVDSDFRYYYNNVEEDVWVTNARNFDVKVVGYWSPYNDESKLAGGGSANFMKSSMAYDFLDTYLVISVPTGQAGTVWINGVEINSFYNYGDAGLSAAAPSWYSNQLPALKNFNFYHAGTIDNNQVNAWHYDHGTIFEPGWGDEIVMDVVVRGFDWTHLDALGIDSYGNMYKSPNSHDSSYFSTPEPGTLSLLGLGLLGIAPMIRRKRKNS